MTREIQIATRTLIVLCGTAGAGKSTFAGQHFEPTQVVSSDLCRALLCDGDRTQNIDPDIFDLFHFLIQKRLKLGRLTVADSTALYDFARRRLLELAHEADSHTCLLVFNVPRTICLQRDQQRPRHVGEAEICTQDALLQEALLHIHHEPWEQIHVLSETDAEVRFIWQTSSKERLRSSGHPSEMSHKRLRHHSVAFSEPVRGSSFIVTAGIEKPGGTRFPPYVRGAAYITFCAARPPTGRETWQKRAVPQTV